MLEQILLEIENIEMGAVVLSELSVLLMVCIIVEYIVFSADMLFAREEKFVIVRENLLLVFVFVLHLLFATETISKLFNIYTSAE